ncbi:putative lipoprotein [Staphylococcus aureus]|uniref:Lipoprotein n=17 Tax=Staphylococcus aureus TaxID=1280 RepID=A0AAX2K1E0_STAAU|nr:tandem lipoprotein [Staphylococcus aureus subsp. aureus 21310]EMZ07874.1 tandem lipoprotein [Staphylococcus aureus M1228]EWB72265.1 tandem lipoprotein [Staphylococcus aureus W85432]EWI48323.1 tandem lipoprotein [Staphylococcus aureus W33563]EWP17390.1 tandem lipoprotein [Staphylococcus aureus M1242]KDP55959.1 tandem lipoprotein [Staphylococcus aureus subsp. aureus 21251]CAC5440286.1 putative lipoprotein [Staphylococcus aureus]CCG15085.1 putative lipoprotein [Staphylococcus aureus subsp. a
MMGYLKRIGLCISLLILSIFVTSCDSDNKITGDSKEAQIKKSFAKTLDMYPIKNLEDLYDKEGYRDGEFKKGDKGTWVVRSEMIIQPKGKSLTSRGMILYMNRNTRTTTGYFSIEEIDSRKNLDERETEKKYPVKIINNKIIPTVKIKDEKLKKEIENFKFFVQYGSFKGIENYENGHISYNSEGPIYSARYQLKNDDYNVKELRKRYDIPTEKAPKLLLKGSGDLKGSSVGYKEIEFIFLENKKENIYFSDGLNLIPGD